MLATAEGLVCHAPAKLNLYFELIARRDDGYHDVETLMVPISLYDTLTFDPLADDEPAVTEEHGIDFHVQQPRLQTCRDQALCLKCQVTDDDLLLGT